MQRYNGLSDLRTGSIACNTLIAATKNKTMKATSLGLWYVQIPNNFVIDKFGNVVELKVYKGNTVIIRDRK
jgi:hypothetical protein